MMDVYVGRQRNTLVLKYPAGLDRKNICRFYPLGDDAQRTIVDSGRWFKGIENVRFHSLKYSEYEIFPFEFDAISLIEQGYKEGFVHKN